MSYTVFGASGFIGSNLVRWLRAQGFPCWTPGRNEDVLNRPLGHAIYCIGLTADFRHRPYDTVQAHVCYLLNVLKKAKFESLLYLSSTRVYAEAATSHEETKLYVTPSRPNDLYNLSKLMGESLCFASERPNVRVARLSNVYGKDFSSENFLASLIQEAVGSGKVVLRTTLASEKDYVDVNDVVCILSQIASSGHHRIYNIASGINTTNGALLEAIQQRTGCAVEVLEGSSTVTFPPICIDRIRGEFNYTPVSILDSLGELITEYQRKVKSSD